MVATVMVAMATAMVMPVMATATRGTAMATPGTAMVIRAMAMAIRGTVMAIPGMAMAMAMAIPAMAMAMATCPQDGPAMRAITRIAFAIAVVASTTRRATTPKPTRSTIAARTKSATATLQPIVVLWFAGTD